MPQAWWKLHVPLYIGITGHRNIRPEDKERLKKLVKDVLEQLRASHPWSPIVLLTPLAEGADRLAAMAAVESDIKFVAPLPMLPKDYDRDFSSENSKAEFRELLSKAWDWFVVPETSHASATAKTKAAAREQAYARVGTYLAQHSVLLIALWDGVSKATGSGTSQVVNLRLNGTQLSTAMSQTPFHNLQAGPVLHIVTPRTNNINTSKPAFSKEMYYPEVFGDKPLAERIQNDILFHVDQYNKDISRIAGGRRAEIQARGSSMLTEEETLLLSSDARANLDRFKFTDFLADKFKKKRIASLALLLSLVLLAFLYLQMYLEFWPVPLVLVVYPSLLAVSGAIFNWAKFQRYDSRHEDYRALAEGLRVQIFWDLAQIDENATHHYLYKHVGQLQWIRYSMLAWWVGHHASVRDEGRNRSTRTQDKMKLTFKRWVLEQKDWYSTRSVQTEKIATALERTSNALFIVGVLSAAFLYFIEVFHPLTSFVAFHYWIHHAIVVSVAMMLAISAAIHSYSDKTSLSETSKQYQRMVSLYTLSLKKLATLLDQPDLIAAKQVFFELGKEALTEHGDWLILNRSRPLELPKA